MTESYLTPRYHHDLAENIARASKQREGREVYYSLLLNGLKSFIRSWF